MKISGRRGLNRKFKALPVEARRTIRAAIEKSADEFVALAQTFAPVDSGATRDSIGYTFGEPPDSGLRGITAGGMGDPDLTVTLHAGDATALYVALVENGTRPHEVSGRFDGAWHPGTRPQPFFFPAYRLIKRRARSRISRATTRAARTVAAR